MSDPSPQTPTHTRISLPFQPNRFQEIRLRNLNNIPKYLFRLHAPKTAGRTTTSEVIPPCETQYRRRDIFQLQESAAAAATEVLAEHLTWKCRREPDCNLMSWSSSLLALLQYALYRHTTDRDKPGFEKIFLLILDTTQFPERTFIKDLTIMKYMNDRYKSEDLVKLISWRQKDSMGEYLTQGELNLENRCAQVSIQDMINRGLFNILPELAADKNSWNLWASQVIALRAPFKKKQTPSPATIIESRTAISIAQLFGSHSWAIPVAAMLLALKPRRKDDDNILRGFAETFTQDQIEECSLGSMTVDSLYLPEVEQFRQLANDIHKHFIGGDISSMINPFLQLSLSG